MAVLQPAIGGRRNHAGDRLARAMGEFLHARCRRWFANQSRPAVDAFGFETGRRNSNAFDRDVLLEGHGGRARAKFVASLVYGARDSAREWPAGADDLANPGRR